MPADTIDKLRTDLDSVERLLAEGSLLAFSPEEREAMREGARKLQLKLDAFVESFLTVGLIGGTGVGKSSLMNALAGAEISSISHRRPHTEHVLIYRYLHAPMPPALERSRVAWREYTHEAETIRQILLCDLPDFDSIRGAHHDQVLGFLEHLDWLVWVCSPEKYADERFYAFLRQVPKARQNFTFVLNKVDLFFAGRVLETGYEELERVVARFRSHLEDNGISHPLIYAVSATDAAASAQTASWNQFNSLKHQIFQHRDAKEVVAIKAANLDVETHELLSGFRREILSAEGLRRAVADLVEELKGGREEWLRVGREAFGQWLSVHAPQAALGDPAALVGPGYLLALIAQEWHQWKRGAGGPGALGELSPDGGALAPLKRQIERVRDRIAVKLLQSGLPERTVEALEGQLDSEGRWERSVVRLGEFVRMRTEGGLSLAPRRFRAFQYAAYTLLFVLLIVALGGEGAWGALWEHPGWTALGRLGAAVVSHVFSPGGLAALGSYIVLQLLVGLRFFGRYKKSLQRRTQKIIESLKSELADVWEDELDSLINDLDAYDQKLAAHVAAVSQLHRKAGNLARAD